MLTILRYPLKSHRKVITTPKESLRLAELFGILFGDGGITNDWQIVVTLNSTADLEYSAYVSQLFEELFNLKPVIRKRPNQNALVVLATSITMIEYLISKGIVRGNKVKQGFDIPEWITKNKEFKRFFVRGVVSIYLYSHKAVLKYFDTFGTSNPRLTKKYAEWRGV